MPEENQKQYEITLILSPDLREEEINLFQEEFKKNIEKIEGSFKKIGKPEKRNLAYPIKKFQSGYYLSVNFFLAPEKLEELRLILKHKKEILRYLIVFAPEEKLRPKKKLEQKIEKIKPSEKVKEKKTTEKKIPLEDIDKKLEEILGM